MHISQIQIAEHVIEVSTLDHVIHAWINEQFQVVRAEHWDALRIPDMFIQIHKGYGTALVSYDVDIYKEGARLSYTRDDFSLTTDDSYRRCELLVHDDLALKHGLMTFYSAFIVHYRWGLLIHSSCVVDGEFAYLFAGPSGAGKSTVAKLSKPRKLLSDEATLIKIEQDRIIAFDSPFRSDSISSYDQESRPLAAIHLLKQSVNIQRIPIKQSEAVYSLMDKIFYWAYEPAETLKVLELTHKLILNVPAYELEFQKNDLFWERIS